MTWPWRRGDILNERDCAQASALLIEMARAIPGEPGNNVGGWRSGERRFSSLALAHAVIARIRDAALDFAFAGEVAPTDARAWAVVHEDGSYHAPHAHVGMRWRRVVVAYLTDGADLHVADPGTGERFTSRARRGVVVTMPGEAFHWTSPHREAMPRVSIAINAR